MKMKFNTKINRAIIVMSTVLMMGQMAGCGADSGAASGDGSGSEIAVLQGAELEASQSAFPDGSKTDGQTSQAGNQDGTGSQEGGQEGRWHVLDPETAEVVDADFLGVVWKLDEDSFWIVEMETEILEDGSLVSGSPSSDAVVPDSDLIQVVFDENTRFYIRTIYNGGERYEDSEAGISELGEKDSVDLKGSFLNDVFHATEVRINKVS